MDGDGDLRTRRGLAVAAGDLQWSFSRAGGPGGQNVNKTSTKATLVIDLAALTGPSFAVERVRSALGGQLRVTSQESSSQWRNRQLCLERAAALIDDAARPPTAVRRPSKPKRGAVERRLQAKRINSEKKESRRPGDW